jgi:hypothetical protein
MLSVSLHGHIVALSCLGQYIHYINNSLMISASLPLDFCFVKCSRDEIIFCSSDMVFSSLMGDGNLPKIINLLNSDTL